MSISDWLKSHNIYSKDFYKKGNRSLKRWLAIFFTSFTAMLLLCIILLVTIANIYLGKLQRGYIKDMSDVVPSSAVDVYGNKNIINIMLYGIDSRDMNEISRSDSIMLLTIDKKHKKIKMTSIARDTRVDIEGHGKDKVNHAFAYGWSKEGNIVGGARLSLKTINNAFNLNVTDYVTANFWSLSDIIDYIGGVEIDVSEAEMRYMNDNYIPFLREYGIDCQDVANPGKQVLSGGQAVAYCRIRYIGGDVKRGERQREVLTAMYDKAKTLNVAKYPKLISLILNECTTSLTNSEILSLMSWAVTNMNGLKFENLGIPTEDIEKSDIIGGVWYYTYDVDKAAKKIENFILETDN